MTDEVCVSILPNDHGGYSIYPVSDAALDLFGAAGALGNYPDMAGAASLCRINSWTVLDTEDLQTIKARLLHQIQQLQTLAEQLEAAIQSIPTDRDGPEAWIIRHPHGSWWSILLPADGRTIGRFLDPHQAATCALTSGFFLNTKPKNYKL